MHLLFSAVRAAAIANENSDVVENKGCSLEDIEHELTSVI